MFSAWYGHLDDVVTDLRECGLSFPVVHAEKAIGAGLGSETDDEAEDALARLEINCRMATALGARTLVLHLWERPTGDTSIERNLAHLPACLDTAAVVQHVQLKDFDGRLHKDGARQHLLPGEGSLDLQSFLTGLLARGYGGAITVESSAIAVGGELDAERLQKIGAVVRGLAAS